MNTTSFFESVQQCLHNMGQSPTMSMDERDILDDYEAQEFSADACADEIARSRT